MIKNPNLKKKGFKMSHLHVQRKAVDLSVDEFIQNTVSLTIHVIVFLIYTILYSNMFEPFRGLSGNGFMLSHYGIKMSGEDT